VDQLYSGTLLVSLLAGGAALLGAMVRRARQCPYERWYRAVASVAGVAWFAAALSFAVHLGWGHTPGGPDALSTWPFILAHKSFLIAAGLPAVARLVNPRVGRFALL
jgi:hypothetical protein